MDFSKIKKISFILLILFILLFPFWCVKGFCVETNLDLNYVDNLRPNYQLNGSLVSGDAICFYFSVTEGHEYTFKNYDDFNIGFVFMNEVPEVGSSYIGYVQYVDKNGGNRTFVADGSYAVVFVSSATIPNFDKISIIDNSIGQSGAVNDLVNNVGISSIWNIFDISINYIVVVVLFAFGCYIIFRIIRKISKGKEGL